MMDERRPSLPHLPVQATLGERLRKHVGAWALLLLLACITYVAFPAPSAAHINVPPAGATAPRDVVAPLGFVVRKGEDELARESDALARSVLPIYRFSASAYDSALARSRAFFAGMVRAGTPPIRPSSGPAVRLGPEELAFLANGPDRRDMAEAVETFLGGVLSRGVADAGVMRGERSDRVLLRRGDEEQVVERDSILTFADLVERAELESEQWPTPDAQRAFRRLAAAFYQPTIVLDESATEQRRAAARASLDSTKVAVSAGDRVVGEGEVISPETHEKLLALQAALSRRDADTVAARSAAGLLLYNVLVLGTFWMMLLLYRREDYHDQRHMAFFTGIFTLVVLLSAGLMRLFPGRPELIPIPLAAMLVTMLFNGRVALMASIALAILLGGQWSLREGNALFFGVVGGVAAAVGMRALRRRQALYVTIGIVVIAYLLGALTLGLMFGWTTEAMAASALAGLVTATASAALALLLLPLGEQLTGVTTSLTLLELSDFRRPLLRRLAIEAPGTWAHSIAMANLCEAACEAIGANGLLARVGCYYHDIGKLARPLYFVENQRRGANPHDGLPPDESARLIRNHVLDGLALAEEAGLPPVVKAFIPEHHGTTDIKYFLHRARRQDPEAGTRPEYYYPGPRPQSAETAVVMLADSAEAAIRVLDDQSPERVRAAIDQLVGQRLASGQLDEAPLTLRDIDRVKDVFVRVMSGIHHNRVEYPRPSGAQRPAELERAGR